MLDDDGGAAPGRRNVVERREENVVAAGVETRRDEGLRKDTGQRAEAVRHPVNDTLAGLGNFERWIADMNVDLKTGLVAKRSEDLTKIRAARRVFANASEP
jgi:hypothetical protein